MNNDRIMESNMPELTVTSEIYEEYDYKTKVVPSIEGNIISEFPFLLPKGQTVTNFDQDDDLDIERPQKEVIKIEHSPKTSISMVGLQVWRGAFLLGDLLIHLGRRGQLRGRQVMELGAGTGLTSFVAAMYADSVVCTDIDLGGILDLIKLNIKYNSKLIKSQFKVMSLDFMKPWSEQLTKEIERTDIIFAADVIYDDDVTAAFVATIQKMLNSHPPKTIYIVLEKRYVFTIEHMDSVAPCYETFLSLLRKVQADSAWTVDQLPLDFPKFFTYDRIKDLVLWRITSK